MKKYSKYVIGTLGFFFVITLLDLVLGYEVDLIINLGTSLVYLIFEIIFDKILLSKKEGE